MHAATVHDYRYFVKTLNMGRSWFVSLCRWKS